MRKIIFVAILLAAVAQMPALAQPSPLPPVTGEGSTMVTGTFGIIVDPKEYPGVGKEETEDTRMLSLLVAYGLVNGIDWERVGTKNEIKIDERMYAIVHDMKLDEVVPYEDCFRYTYSYQYALDEVNKIKVGESIEAAGESEEKNMAKAWKEARHAAFVDAVAQALGREYTDKQSAIPNDVVGMITTYEILYDDYNFTDGIYRFKIKTWVSFEQRKNEFYGVTSTPGGEGSTGQS